ncbi:FAD-dependent oxidoreductase [Paracoccus suum]|uniref:FAD-dependent oxidoreductase n=1 Tax=Paracoccus suum TaxID=2259340 RepID=A0A344PMD3_9RHOB|nr:FAD-dependent monooxygenase [Paracoccus suum]AXC50538.1 FAD-dependent oxidoreductase [Paracoccus suum]
MPDNNIQGRVLIAGGGPVGLLVALGLARRGVPVTLVERESQIRDDPRAATTHPATLEVLDDFGLEGEVRAAGLVAPVFQFWDRPACELVAEFDHGLLADETRFPYVVQCEQFKTSRIALAHLRREADAEIMMGYDVVAAGQDDDGVWLDVRPTGSQDAPSRLTGSWLVGADGGRSLVRKAAEIPFDGFTYPEQFLVLTTPFDFEAERGYCFRSYFADPEEWCNCFKVIADGPPGLWRTVFPVSTDLSEDEIMSDEAVQAKMQKFFPLDRDHEIVHRNLYRVHQRVAERFRKGRILLAGDAAHINNPIGGMGLNGGIQDAGNLVAKLSDLWHGRAGEEVLDLYDLQRRSLSINFVQAQSIENKKRLEASDPETRRENMENLRQIAADPVKAKAFLLGSSMLRAQRTAAAMKLD